jgi:hypothetical protein
MHDDTRAGVAHIAGRLISRHDATDVYDHGAGRYRMIDGVVSGDRVNVFDYHRSVFIDGLPHERGFSLYDYGHYAHVDLSLQGNRFEGYDHATGGFFSGTVEGRDVQVFDAHTGQYHNYSL